MSTQVEDADVVVVGGGGAGMAAAVAAAETGARTVLLEKEDAIGGTTALSVGSFTASGTSRQVKAGISDSVEAFCEDMVAFAPHLGDREMNDLRWLLATEAGPTFEWLERLGVIFAGPFPEPPNRVPRMFNALPSSRSYLNKLGAEARRLQVDIRVGSAVGDLVVTSTGRVGGVRYTANGKQRQIAAAGGIVMASGDFSGNRDLLREFASEAAAAAVPIRPASNGDSIQIARRNGIALRGMDIIFGPQLRFPRSPAKSWIDRLPNWDVVARLAAFYIAHAPKSLLKLSLKSLLLANMSPVDALFEKGAKLVDMDGRVLDAARPAYALAAARDVTGYILLDRAVAQTFGSYPNYISTAPGIAYAYFSDYQRGRPDIVHSSSTARGLAAKVGLEATAFDEATAGMGEGPYHAMGPVYAMLTVSEGGMAVDTSLRALKEDGTPLPGLYAAGAAGQGGLWLKGHGQHLAWAFTSGRLAGKNAALATSKET